MGNFIVNEPRFIDEDKAREYFEAILKRGLYGTFHSVSGRHRQHYAIEFECRWNHRVKLGVDDVQRTAIALKSIEGKRLTYRPLSA